MSCCFTLCRVKLVHALHSYVFLCHIKTCHVIRIDTQTFSVLFFQVMSCHTTQLDPDVSARSARTRPLRSSTGSSGDHLKESAGKAPSASLPSRFNVTIAASRPDTLLPMAVSSTLPSYRVMAAIFCTDGAAPKLPNTSTHAARRWTFGSCNPTTGTTFAGKDSWPRDCNAFAASLVPIPYASSGPVWKPHAEKTNREAETTPQRASAKVGR